MIILWNSADMEVELTFVRDDHHDTVRWQADRTLAKGMLAFLKEQLDSRGLGFTDIRGIGVFQGPGSFTGLRIGLSVANALAVSQNVPIVATQGDDWIQTGISRIGFGENDIQALPFYGADAHITPQKK